MLFHIQRGTNIDHQDQFITPSSFSVNKIENSKREVNKTNLLALNSWKKPCRLAMVARGWGMGG